MSSRDWPVKPSIPWSAIVEVPVYPYTLEQLQAITAALGIAPHPVLDMQLERAAQRYFADKTRISGHPPNPALLRNETAGTSETTETIKQRALVPRPPSGTRRRTVTKLHQKTAQFLEALEALDDASRLEFAHSQVDPAAAFELLELLTEKTTELGWRLYGQLYGKKNQQQKAPYAKDVRTPDQALERYIETLAEIYEHATGKHMGRAHPNRTKKDGGPFLRFLNACLTPIDPTRGEQGLGDFVKRMKRKRRS